MSEPPPPDILDNRGRFRRLVLSFVIAVVVAVLASWFADDVTRGSTRRGVGSFWVFVTAGSFAASFAISLAIQNALEKRRYRKSLSLPSATLRR